MLSNKKLDLWLGILTCKWSLENIFIWYRTIQIFYHVHLLQVLHVYLLFPFPHSGMISSCKNQKRSKYSFQNLLFSRFSDQMHATFDFPFLWSWLSRKLKLTSFIISIKGYAERCTKRPQYVDKGKLNKCILKSKCGHCILLDTVTCSDHCILDIYLVLLFRMLNVLPNMWNFRI